MNKEFGVKLNMVPVQDIKSSVDKLCDERRDGIFSKGSIDLIWINGENFRLLKQGKMLFQFAKKLPNMTYIDLENPTIKMDFGYPVDNYESPYGSAQFVFNYDSARVPNPPATMEELMEWIKKNPGKFAYPGLPDFTGSAFVRHVFYYTAGYKNLRGAFDEDIFDKHAPQLWQLLREIEPYLWKKGRVFPKNSVDLDKLVQKGEVYFGMGYALNRSARLIAEGIYPKTMKTLIFKEGTIGNTHYVAIPFNASSKAGAMILANLILDPISQLEKMKPTVWGDQTIIDINRLPKDLKKCLMISPVIRPLCQGKNSYLTDFQRCNLLGCYT